jgi:hypothetical protein
MQFLCKLLFLRGCFRLSKLCKLKINYVLWVSDVWKFLMLLLNLGVTYCFYFGHRAPYRREQPIYETFTITEDSRQCDNSEKNHY